MGKKKRSLQIDVCATENVDFIEGGSLPKSRSRTHIGWTTYISNIYKLSETPEKL